jgi:hypothetical protein
MLAVQRLSEEAMASMYCSPLLLTQVNCHRLSGPAITFKQPAATSAAWSPTSSGNQQLAPFSRSVNHVC